MELSGIASSAAGAVVDAPTQVLRKVLDMAQEQGAQVVKMMAQGTGVGSAIDLIA